MAYTFLKAKGVEIGESPYESAMLEPAKELLELARLKQKELLLPQDHVVVRDPDSDAIRITDNSSIPEGLVGVDVGPGTLNRIEEILSGARTVFWNGPFGIFERRPFAKGTFKIAEILAGLKAITIVGGGDSARAVEEAGFSDRINHISTGGGASLELVSGKNLPGLDALSGAVRS